MCNGRLSGRPLPVAPAARCRCPGPRAGPEGEGRATADRPILSADTTLRGVICEFGDGYAGVPVPPPTTASEEDEADEDAGAAFFRPFFGGGISPDRLPPVSLVRSTNGRVSV